MSARLGGDLSGFCEGVEARYVFVIELLWVPGFQIEFLGWPTKQFPGDFKYQN